MLHIMSGLWIPAGMSRQSLRPPVPTILYSLACFIVTLAGGLASAAPGDLDAAFVSGIGAGITPPGYPDFESGTGSVNAVALQSDGKIIAGGRLSKYNNSGSLATLRRINPDGSLDSTFNSGGAAFAAAGGEPEINAIVVLEDDSILVGGSFTSYNGTGRSCILKLHADGSLDTGFAPAGLGGTYPSVRKILVQSDGSILVGGGFTQMNGGFRNNLARLSAGGVLDPGFSPMIGSLGAVSDMKIAADGKIYVSGSAATSASTGLLRLYPDGVVDGSFAAALGGHSQIDAILLLPSGTILAGGFTYLESVGYNKYLAALTSTGQIDTAFMANMGAGPGGYSGYEILEAPDGKILIASRFLQFDGKYRPSIARLLADGTPDPAFAPLPYTTGNDFLTHFYSAVYQPDGKIVAGGWFDRVTDPLLETYNLTRFEGDLASGPGKIRWTVKAADVAEGNTIMLTATRFDGLDGAVAVNYGTSSGTAAAGDDFDAASGTFAWANGEGGSKTIVISTLQDIDEEGNEDFSVELSSPSGGATIAAGGGVATITILDDDSAPVFVVEPQSTTGITTLEITLSGSAKHALPVSYQWFKDAGATPVGNSASLRLSNLLPANAGSYVLRATIIDPQSGLPRSVDSAPAVLTIVEPPGSLDPTWSPGDGFNSTVSAMHILADKSSLAGGSFSTYGGATAKYLAKLAPDGALVTGWPAGTGPNNQIRNITPAAGGKFLVAGTFTMYDGTSQRGIARIGADGALDSGFVRTAGGNANVARELPDGSVVAGFDGIGLRKFAANGTELASFAPFGASVTNVLDFAFQSDGKIIVGAQRSTGARIATIYRLNPDLSVDAGFTLAESGAGSSYFYKIQVDSADLIFVAGSFSSLGGVLRANAARLLPNGEIDPGFVPNVNNAIYTMLVQDDGRVVIGGYFNGVDGKGVGRIARLLPDGSLDEGFFPGTGANNSVTTLARAPSGELYAGGAFTGFSGAPAGGIVRMNGDFGSMQFEMEMMTVNEQDGTAIIRVKRLVGSRGAASVQYQRAGGSALAGTDFNGVTSGTLVWADGDHSDREIEISLIDNTTSDGARDLVIQLYNAIYPAELGSISTATLTILDDEALATIVGAPEPVTTPEANPAAFSVSATSATAMTYQWLKDGAPIAGATSAELSIPSVTLADAGDYSVRITNAAGDMTSPAAALTVLISPTAVSATWAPAGPGAATLNGTVRAILPLADGGALVGGDFSLPQRGIVRLDAAGAKVESFTPALDTTTGGTGVHDIMMDDEGRIYISGKWGSIAGKAYANLVRLNADMTIDDSFAAVLGSGPNGLVRDVSPDGDGGVLIGGSFTAVSEKPGTGGFARIQENGRLDRTLVSYKAGDVYRIARAAGTEKIYVAGSISNYGSKSYFFRLNADGTVDATYNPANAGGVVRDFALRPDGGVVLGGAFTGSPARLAALTASGAADTSFMAGASLNDAVNSVAIQPNGRIVAGGAFTTFQGPANRFGRVDPNGKADTTLNLGTGFGGEVMTIVPAAGGRLWVGGNFTQFKGATAKYLTRLHGDDVETNILSQPEPRRIEVGQTATFAVTATGTASPGYQWYKDDVAISDGGTVSGANTDTLQIANVQEADEGRYAVRVSAGSTEVMSRDATLRAVAGYEIDTIISGGEFPAGKRFVLSATGAGAGALSYQWKKGGEAISGANSPEWVLAAPAAADSGGYTLEITNSFGTTVSPAVELTFVEPAPAGLRHALASVAVTGANVILPIPDGRFFIGVNYGSQCLRLFDNLGAETAVPAFNGAVLDVIRQANGGYLVAGTFTAVGGQPAKWLARLRADFTLDTVFQATLGMLNGIGGNQGASKVLELPGGRIVVAGRFMDLNGISGTQGLIVLRADGSRDTGFVSRFSTNGNVNGLAYDQDDESILIAGSGLTYAGAYKPLHRVRLDGSRVSTMNVEVNDQAISSLAVQEDRKILIGGAFKTVQGGEHPSLVRLHPDGSVDMSFVAFGGLTSNNYIGMLSSLALEAGGDIVAGGNFQVFNGVAHNSLLRFRPDGSVDSRFDAGLGVSAVNALAVAADGGIYLAGNAQTYEGVTVNHSFVLHGDRIPLAFAAKPAAVEALVGESISLSATGVGTSAVSYQWFKDAAPLSDGGDISGSSSGNLMIANAGAGDAGIYRVELTNMSGTLSADAAVAVFDAPAILGQPGGGTFFVGGSVELQVRVLGTAPMTYVWTKDGNPIAGADGTSLVLADLGKSDGGVYQFMATNASGSATSAEAVVSVLLPPGEFSGDFPVTAGVSQLLASVLPSGGGAFVGGSFSAAGPTGSDTPVANLARLMADGTVDPGFLPNPNGQVNFIVSHQTDGLLAGGSFTAIAGQSRGYFAKINAAGGLDSAFASALGAGPNGEVTDAVVQPDGKIVIAGSFSQVSGEIRNGLARLDADGGLDAAFAPPLPKWANFRDIELLPDGKIVGVGSFNVGGRQNIVRFNADGTLDAGFTATLNYFGAAVAAQPDGKIVVGGNFDAVNGQAGFGSLARLNVDGSIDPGFPGGGAFPGTVYRIAIQPNGRILAGGNFATYSGSGRGLVRLLADGTVDDSFPTGAGWSGYAQTYDIKVTPSGTIWVAGGTDKFKNQTVNRLVVFNGDEPVAPPAGATFASWAADNELPPGKDGPQDDADSDGISNLMEYALGLDPLDGDVTELPVAQISDGRLNYTYRRLRADLIYQVETAGDFAGWTIGGVDQGTPLPDGTTTASVPLTAGPAFLRLKVVLAP